MDVTCSTEITITSRPVKELPVLPLPLECRWCPGDPGCVDVMYWRIDGGERIWGIAVARESETARGCLGVVPLSALLPEVLRILGPQTAASPDLPRAKSSGTVPKPPTETRLWLGRDPSYRIDFSMGCGRISSILAFSPSLAPAGYEARLTRAVAD